MNQYCLCMIVLCMIEFTQLGLEPLTEMCHDLTALSLFCSRSSSRQASLGTTKYCSYFLKSMQCPKPDCMYLHELGDEAASFTKEEMQVWYTGRGGDVCHGLQVAWTPGPPQVELPFLKMRF